MGREEAVGRVCMCVCGGRFLALGFWWWVGFGVLGGCIWIYGMGIWGDGGLFLHIYGLGYKLLWYFLGGDGLAPSRWSWVSSLLARESMAAGSSQIVVGEGILEGFVL